MWYWKKIRQADQEKRIKGPQINSCSYSHMTFEDSVRTSMGEKVAFSINNAGKPEYSNVD